METVVLSSKDTVVGTTVSNTSTVLNDTSTNLIDNNSVSYVTLTDSNTIVVESNNTTVLLAGALGPAGATSEDLDVYSKRIDFISDNELYKGEALVGSSEAAAVWRIRKVTIAVDSDITETWASGNANFDKQWTQRLALSYS